MAANASIPTLPANRPPRPAVPRRADRLVYRTATPPPTPAGRILAGRRYLSAAIPLDHRTGLPLTAQDARDRDWQRRTVCPVAAQCGHAYASVLASGGTEACPDCRAHLAAQAHAELCELLGGEPHVVIPDPNWVAESRETIRATRTVLAPTHRADKPLAARAASAMVEFQRLNPGWDKSPP